MAKENTSMYIILGLLDHEDLSGYDIKKKIDYMISHFWDIGYGQIYPTLKAMEQTGLITKKVSENSKGPEKNLYSITDSGRKLLREWLLLPEAKEYTKYEILVKLFFGKQVSEKENRKRIEVFKKRHLQNATVMKMFRTNLEQVLHESDDHLYYYLTVLFGEKIYNAYIEWANEAEELLERKEQNANLHKEDIK